jgi:hypothetical protein
VSSSLPLLYPSGRPARSAGWPQPLWATPWIHYLLPASNLLTGAPTPPSPLLCVKKYCTRIIVIYHILKIIWT